MITLALLSPLLFLALLMVLQRVEEAVFPPRRAPANASDSRPPGRALSSRTATAEGRRRRSTAAGAARSRRAAAAPNVTS
jgi:hypothetical protein